jgi:hypothetical protein
MERRLLTFFGPSQVGDVGRQPDRSLNRTAGVQGEWELRRDSTGRTYLVRGDEGRQARGERMPQPAPEHRGDPR